MTVALEPLLPPIPAMLLVLVVLGGLMLGLRTLQRRRRIHPELSRKMLHVGMGFVTLTFPWLFGTAMWPVVLLGVLASASLYTLRRSSWLRERFGGVLHGVSRDSLGEIYFPVGVAGLFFLADGDTVSYIIPVLLLALGDAVAALIGVRYGSLKYETGEGQKSLEGSLAFLLVAFLSAHVPLLLATNTGRAESLLIGLILGLLLTLIEAVAWRGLDNLFIPLGAFLLLRSFLPLGVLDLLVRLGVTLALVGFAVLYRRQTTLNSGAVLGSALIAYLAWALGGWQWMVAPITLFSTYALLFPRENRDGTSRTHDISDVLRATGVGISWLFLAAAYDRPDFLLPYTVSFAAHLAIIGIIRLQERFNRNEEGLVTAVAVIKSALLMLVPYYLCAGPNSRPALVTLLVLAPIGTIVGIAGAHLSGIVPGDNPLKHRRWVLQLGVAIGSALTAKGIAPW